MRSRLISLRRYIKPASVAFGIFLVAFFLLDLVIMPLYTEQGKTTRVPDVQGMPVAEAVEALRKAGLDPKEAETRPDKNFPVGAVAVQNPGPESIVKFGRGVYLTISGGEIQVEVPILRGKSLREATFSLERSGLKLGDVRFEPSDDIFINTVISQAVDPGRKVRAGTSIAVIVSQGKAGDKRAVPTVTQRSLNEARRLLTQAGFKLGTISYQVSLDLLPNTVIEQYPKPGEMALFGQAVDLFVAQKADSAATKEN